jgi:diketogulonate reductase-like aldo/keto reductase
MIPDIELDGGVPIPQLGFGVFQVAPEGAQDAVEAALSAGYRHIDTAAAYNNESGVGAAVRASGLPRNEVFITTKLRNGDQGYDEALRAYDASLERLGVDHVDLYLIHWPAPTLGRYVESWRALERILDEGRVRAIGVSNFLPEHLDALAAEGGRVPAVNQVELHPTYQQADVVNDSRARGIAIEAYSPLGQGADLSDERVTSIASAHDRTPAQVVLRWHLQSGHIVIPKTTSPARMAENLAVFDFELSIDELGSIGSMNTAERLGNDPLTWDFHQIR